MLMIVFPVDLLSTLNLILLNYLNYTLQFGILQFSHIQSTFKSELRCQLLDPYLVIYLSNCYYVVIYYIKVGSIIGLRKK